MNLFSLDKPESLCKLLLKKQRQKTTFTEVKDLNFSMDLH